MRAIHTARIDKTRPVLVLTRETVLPALAKVTIAPITTRVRGLSTEVSVGRQNGLSQPSVVNCDNISTIPASDLGAHVGFLLDSQEPQLTAAIHAAFNLQSVDAAS